MTPDRNSRHHRIRPPVEILQHFRAVHIPFPRAVRDALLAERLANEQPYAPYSGNVGFQIRREEDKEHALWLLRLSYFRHALKKALEPAQMLADESARLNISGTLQRLISASCIHRREKDDTGSP